MFKRRWFSDSALRELFGRVVATHPKGWDAVCNGFSPAGAMRYGRSGSTLIRTNRLKPL